MKSLLTLALFISLLLIGPSLLLAKGKTIRIVVEGNELSKPLDITDPKILAINVWTGPGTSSNQPGFNPNAPSFIVDWSQGPVTEMPKGLQKYRISFYVNSQNERLAYVVFYVYDPSTKHGYVYLPGGSDEYYKLNVGTIFRGVEGKWFHAWSEWEKIAGPLINEAKTHSQPAAERD